MGNQTVLPVPKSQSTEQKVSPQAVYELARVCHSFGHRKMAIQVTNYSLPKDSFMHLYRPNTFSGVFQVLFCSTFTKTVPHGRVCTEWATWSRVHRMILITRALESLGPDAFNGAPNLFSRLFRASLSLIKWPSWQTIGTFRGDFAN